MKNMRAKIKQKVVFRDENQNKVEQDEFSFKTKYDSETNKIYDLKLENSKRDNSILYEEENLRIQKEAKDLIKKTRNMMENLDMDKLKILNKPKSHSTSKSPQQKNFSVSFDNKMKRGLDEEFIHNTIEGKKKSEFYNSQRNYNKKSYSGNFNSYSGNLEHEILFKNHLNINVENMTQKMVNYSKRVKDLEKELKEKNNLIKKLHEKIDKKNEEIAKLNEILSKENASSFKVELSTLNRKIASKEKNFDESKKSFEKTIEEYKNQMNDLIRFNDCSTLKIKELEDLRENLREMVRKLETENIELNSDCRKKQEMFENEKNLNIGIQSKFDSMRLRLQTLSLMFQDLRKIKDTHKDHFEKFFINVFKFYKE